MKNNYENLIIAVIECAIKDIVAPTENTAKRDVESAKKFLGSEYCNEMLSVLGCSMSGTELLEKAKEVSA